MCTLVGSWELSPLISKSAWGDRPTPLPKAKVRPTGSPNQMRSHLGTISSGVCLFLVHQMDPAALQMIWAAMNDLQGGLIPIISHHRSSDSWIKLPFFLWCEGASCRDRQGYVSWGPGTSSLLWKCFCRSSLSSLMNPSWLQWSLDRYLLGIALSGADFMLWSRHLFPNQT